MEQIKFQSEIRQAKKKGAARKIRQAGFVPGVLYGPPEQPVLLKVEKKSAEKTFRHLTGHNVMADLILKNNGETETIRTIVKEMQIDPLTGRILHLDFYRVRMDKPVVMEVSIHTTGENESVKQGGILDLELRELKVEALPRDIPEKIELDIAGLKIGDAVLVKDLKLPENVKVLEDVDRVVVSILAPRAEEEVAKPAEEAAPVAAEPEVISEEKAEERRKMKEETKEETEKTSG